MNIRITSRMLSDQATARLNERLNAFQTAQNDLATGKRIHVASDDVIGMNSVLSLKSALAANAQAQRNAQDGLTWTELADSRLDTLVNQLQRVRELTVEAGNPTTSPTGLAGIAKEVTEILESFEALANSRHQGRPLFAGYSGADPVTESGGTWSYTGGTGDIRRRVSETDEVVVNVTGDEIFGFDAGENVFQLLSDIATDIGSGNRAAVGAALSGLDRAMDRLLAGRATLGAAANRIEKAIFRNQADEVNLRTQLSTTEDVDIAEAIMELQIQEVSYQAAQGALAKSLQSSLATFLR